ncbi:MAG: D-serine ammonia-lyase [Eubacteriales bacterium]|nr:D-serine ammonia-lyase [Eubacteriales bacterium]
MIKELRENSSIFRAVENLEETVWINDKKLPYDEAIAQCTLTADDVASAEARWARFADFFKVAFPETCINNGLIESPLKELSSMKDALSEKFGAAIPGRLFLKMDSHLPISGSIKARGGIYEVLKTAEDIALSSGLLHEGDSYACLATDRFRELFSQYSVAVGSTGNLGLSIGIISAKLGFKVTVHMSADAREWKKKLLRSKGVRVIEYEGDYSAAVESGRKEALKDDHCHFVDDENSKTLFLGYSVAALRLKNQLDGMGIKVDASHPLMVYLPCGVGGGPGGVAFGLKTVFGDNVHCFFAEPTHSCCMLLGMATGLHNGISVRDAGVDNMTIADGLAVGRASGFVGKLMQPFMSGCYTLSDERMSMLLAMLADTEKIFLEPSALAGMYGPVLSSTDSGMRTYLESVSSPADATHIAWATGGSMVPTEEMEEFVANGNSYF